MSLGKIAGIAVALGMAALVAINWADIKRYIKIESM